MAPILDLYMIYLDLDIVSTFRTPGRTATGGAAADLKAYASAADPVRYLE